MKLNLLKSITSTKRLEESLEEVEHELESIQPEIDKLEKAQAKLRELKLAKQKLITLKLSLKSILENFSEIRESGSVFHQTSDAFRKFLRQAPVKSSFPDFPSGNPSPSLPDRIFLPEQALEDVHQLLRQKHSLNYELFRAIVCQGGRASTQQIKDHLIRNNICQPSSGESFEKVALTDISSRINYLVRKGIVVPEGRGIFLSLLGWQDEAQGETILRQQEESSGF